MIHRKKEGEIIRFGLNYDYGYRSLIILIFVFPYWISGKKYFRSWVNDSVEYGRIIRWFGIYFRIRNKWFSKDIATFIFHFLRGKRAYKPQTRFSWEDLQDRGLTKGFENLEVI